MEDLSVFARESTESKVPLSAWGKDIPVPSELEKFVIKVSFDFLCFVEQNRRCAFCSKYSQGGLLGEEYR